MAFMFSTCFLSWGSVNIRFLAVLASELFKYLGARCIRLDGRRSILQMGDWPAIPGEVLSVLTRYFKTPLILQAAFDDERSCDDLLSQIFPDMVSEDVSNLSAALNLWREEFGPSFKRQRRAAVADALWRFPVKDLGTVQDSFNQVTRLNPVLLLESFAK